MNISGNPGEANVVEDEVKHLIKKELDSSSLSVAGATHVPSPQDLELLQTWKAECGLDLIRPYDPKQDARFIQVCYNLMNNYPRLASWNVVTRLPIKGERLFFLVFKPFDRNYDPLFNGMDAVRQKLTKSTSAIIITREIRAAKVHYNVLCSSKEDMYTKFHNKNTKRYLIFVKEIEAKRENALSVHDYIVKESKVRYFEGGYKHPRPDIYARFKNEIFFNNLLLI